MQDYWGKGFASEALKTLIEFAFTTLVLRRLTARVDCENHASHRVVLNNGFTEEGCLREHLLIDGQPHSVSLFGLLLAEWQCERNLDSLKPSLHLES